MIESLRINGTNISYCRSQTYDSAGNMAGKKNGAALNLKKKKKKKKLRMIEHYIITVPLTNLILPQQKLQGYQKYLILFVFFNP